MIEVMRDRVVRSRGAAGDERSLHADAPTARPSPNSGHQSDTPWRRGREIAPELDGIWTGAFAMGAPNSRIVRRSNALLDWAYGRTFRYAENMSVGSSSWRRSRRRSHRRQRRDARARRPVLQQAAARLVERVAPSRAPVRASGPARTVTTRSRPTPPRRAARATGPRCRSRATPATRRRRCCWGSAVALALDRDRLSDLRGVLTPAAAMGDALLARLPAAENAKHRPIQLICLRQPESGQFVVLVSTPSFAEFRHNPAMKVEMTMAGLDDLFAEIPVQDIANKLGVDENEVNTAIPHTGPRARRRCAAQRRGRRHRFEQPRVCRDHAGRQRSARRWRQCRPGRRSRATSRRKTFGGNDSGRSHRRWQAPVRAVAT